MKTQLVMLPLFWFMIHELLINVYIHSNGPTVTKLCSLADKKTT